MTPATTWQVREEEGSAAWLHALEPEVPARREVWLLEVDAPTLVLGSAQKDTVDRDAAASAGIAVARRRSGGGAVLMVPGEATWIDVVLPRGDELWDDDVTRSFRWLGRVWIDVLAQLGCADVDLTMHTGGLIRGELGATVCFAGIGPGEVMAGGAKLVGLSQRRTRDFARFQCTVHGSWRPEVYGDLLPGEVGSGRGVPAVGTVDADPRAVFATFCGALATV